MLVVAVIFLAAALRADAWYDELPYEPIEDEDVYRAWYGLDEELKSVVQTGIKAVLPHILRFQENLNVSSKCMRSFMHLIMGVRKLDVWALNFLDACAKPPSGFLDYSISTLGNYDQCLRSEGLGRKKEVLYTGKYCRIAGKPILPNKRRRVTIYSGMEEFYEAIKNTSGLIRFIGQRAQSAYNTSFYAGICVPSECSIEDIDNIVRYAADMVHVRATVATCEVEDDLVYEFTLSRILSLSALIFLIMIVFCATIFDYYEESLGPKERNIYSKSVLCFSARRTYNKVFNLTLPEETLSCLHGIRALSLFWIVLCHENVYFGYYHSLVDNMKFMERSLPRFGAQILLNGFLCVDVFFFVGGMVHSYVRTKMLFERGEKRGFITIIIYRLLRLIPAMAVVAFLLILVPGRGPLFNTIFSKMAVNCEKYWWKNVLNIQNFWIFDDMCLPHTWYVACDSQIFLISMIVIPILMKKLKTGIAICVALILGCSTFTAFWAWRINSPPALSLYQVDIPSYDIFTSIYLAFYSHMPHYFLGVLFGYFLAVKKDIKIPKLVQVLGWSASAILFITVLFSSMKWNSGVKLHPVESAAYLGFATMATVISVGWVILCCVSGHGGVINEILSLKFFIPIARLSYLMFVLSVIVQFYFVANKNFPINADHMSMVWRYFGDLCIMFILAAALNFIADSPAMQLGRLYLEGESPKKEASSDSSDPSSSSDEPQNQLKFNNKQAEADQHIEFMNIKNLKTDLPV